MADQASSPSLSGKVVAITGGARGIGLETVKLLLAGGAKVGAGDLDLELLEQELGKLAGESAAFELDVTSRESFEEFLAGVEERLGPVDVLINNAGVMAIEPFHEQSDEISDRMLDVNLRGPMLGMKLAIPGMLARGRGHIVNVVSTAGRFGIPGAAMYSASKFGAFGMTEAVATEYAGTPLEFTAVCPVVVKTELTAGLTQTTRGVPTLEARDVAEAIVKAIHKPRLEVYVPGSIKATYAITQLLPLRLRRAFEKFTRADRVMVDFDKQARAEYDARAFRDKAPH
jgi:NAD(P)-dependent dehydrogenase (short-subunit alcohol dehydrogenase family)